jgi:hypothetical protein
MSIDNEKVYLTNIESGLDFLKNYDSDNNILIINCKFYNNQDLSEYLLNLSCVYITINLLDEYTIQNNFKNAGHKVIPQSTMSNIVLELY